MLAVLEPATTCCQCTLPAAASASLLRLVQTAYRQLAAAVRLVLSPKGALSAWQGMRTVLPWAMVGLVWPDGVAGSVHVMVVQMAKPFLHQVCHNL